MMNGYVVMGDMNPRFERAIRNPAELPGFTCSYPVTEDNAEFWGTLCSDNKLAVLNLLKTSNKHFPGGKTYIPEA